MIKKYARKGLLAATVLLGLVPAASGLKGVLRIVWGTVALECDWEAKP